MHRMILTQRELERIVNSELADPFIFLGMHKVDDKRIVVRVFNPEAANVDVILDGKHFSMNRLAKEGVFELVIESKVLKSYKLEYKYNNGGTYRTKDPYSFLPVLTEYDLFLIGEGNHHKVYEKLGAHSITHGGAKGVTFAVWAPQAKRVSVVGNFNNWDGRTHQMRMRGASGVWELFIPGIEEGDLYKFEIKAKNGDIFTKIDPYAFFFEKRPANACVVYELDNKFEWSDTDWLERRKTTNWLEKPMSVYEVHLGSYKRKDDNQFLTYKELAHDLLNYLLEHNYTHIEIMPVSEHPLDESWGYQVTGYYAVTSRFGTPEEFMYFVNLLHENNLGIILDWVPGHYPKDAFGLGRYDGSALYEHEDPRQGEHMDWGTYIPNFGRNEVKNFLIANALFWMDKYHIDGLRVDAVASMLYLDYSRDSGSWVPNQYGGRENLEAIEFLKYFNSITHKYYPGILTIAEESTAFAGVSKPTELGGLGFDMKWNMGWMNDTLEYIKKDPVYRKYHQHDLTFSLVYAFSENFKLVISHDEVVHGKRSLIDKMPGDLWQKFANLRLFYTYAYCHPGKKLFFMGSEFGQWKEWNCNASLDWHLTNEEPHHKMQKFIKKLNEVYKLNNELWEVDYSGNGFEWIDYQDQQNSILAFTRKNKAGDKLICIFNFTPEVHYGYKFGVSTEGTYEEVLNSDDIEFYGSNFERQYEVITQKYEIHNQKQAISVNIPPLGAVIYRLKK